MAWYFSAIGDCTGHSCHRFNEMSQTINKAVYQNGMRYCFFQTALYLNMRWRYILYPRLLPSYSTPYLIVYTSCLRVLESSTEYWHLWIVDRLVSESINRREWTSLEFSYQFNIDLDIYWTKQSRQWKYNTLIYQNHVVLVLLSTSPTREEEKTIDSPKWRLIAAHTEELAIILISTPPKSDGGQK